MFDDDMPEGPCTHDLSCDYCGQCHICTPICAEVAAKYDISRTAIYASELQPGFLVCPHHDRDYTTSDFEVVTRLQYLHHEVAIWADWAYEYHYVIPALDYVNVLVYDRPAPAPVLGAPIDFLDASAKLAARRSIAALVATEGQETIERTLELLNLALEVGNVAPASRYISAITSTCEVCGHTETIDIPPIAGPEDIITAIGAIKSACPECEERARLAEAAKVLAEYQDGLELLDDQDGGAKS